MVGSYRLMRMFPAFFCALILGVISIGDLDAQRRFGPSPLDTLGKDPDQKVGWEVLKAYRQLGVVEDYQFSFQLKIMPRLDDTKTLNGIMIGSPTESGQISRVDLLDDSQGDEYPLRLLLHNGLFPTAWALGAQTDGLVSLVESKTYFDPIAESNVSIFELLMPFQYWQEFYYEGRTKMRGQPTHVFWMYPPKEDEELLKYTAGVRLYVNDQFQAMMKAEIFDADEVHRKTLTIQDFKKVDGTWIVTEVDVRDELARDKTRFKVTNASVGLDIADYYFTPESLTESLWGKDLTP